MLKQLESEATQKGFRFIVGCDEAGRGPLVGPVVGAACHVPVELEIEGLTDSKKLSPKRREKIFDQLIHCSDIKYGIGIIEPSEIDQINILQASLKAMKEAVDEIGTGVDFIFIDGNRCFKTEIPIEAVVKGDSKVASVAAASIIAKVTRDRIMADLAEMHPEYGFERHKGYPTKEHLEALKKYGPTDQHRLSFAPLKNLYNYCKAR